MAETGHLGADVAQRRHLVELVEPADGDLGEVPGVSAVLEGAVVDLSGPLQQGPQCSCLTPARGQGELPLADEDLVGGVDHQPGGAHLERQSI
jgi:hypothetical protein